MHAFPQPLSQIDSPNPNPRVGLPCHVAYFVSSFLVVVVAYGAHETRERARASLSAR